MILALSDDTAVDVLAVQMIESVMKITSKKSDSTTLLFYFKPNNRMFAGEGRSTLGFAFQYHIVEEHLGQLHRFHVSMYYYSLS